MSSEEKPTPTSAGRPIELEDESNLDAFISEADIALIEFYTNGCGICESMGPVLGSLARQLDVAVGTINPRNDPPLIERFDVRSVPLFVLFLDGEAVARRAEGFIPGDDLTAWIKAEADIGEK